MNPISMVKVVDVRRWTKHMGHVILLCILLICSTTQAQAAHIIKLNIKGAIGPATADYIERAINESQDAHLILIVLDTPGGLDLATRSIIQKFLTSKVPIVSYVSPKGARAASAGTYLLYASTIAAMAPGTELGAASPVNLASGIEGDNKTSHVSVMGQKMLNDAKATIRTLAQLRGRDPVFAEQSVEKAMSLTSSEALQKGVINLIAEDEGDLLKKLNGMVVDQNNTKIIIDTSNFQIQEINPDWRTEFLSIITNPTVAYLLILLGIYGIFFELVNPGYVLPGVVGALSMLVALYALQLLPVSYAGLGLIIIGIMFIIAEGFTPSFGALGVGGTVAFILGSIMLMNTENIAFQIAWSVIWAMAVVNIILFIILLGIVVRARRQKVKNGLVMLVGAKGRTIGEVKLEGQAIIRGEIWSVHAKKPIEANQNIIVVNTSGLLLEIQEDK